MRNSNSGPPLATVAFQPDAIMCRTEPITAKMMDTCTNLKVIGKQGANTVNTYLTRLCEKGFLSSRREGRNNLYTPLVSKDRYLEFESRSVLKRLYGGSLGSFVAALNAEKPLEQSEIDELRQFLDDMSR